MYIISSKLKIILKKSIDILFINNLFFFSVPEIGDVLDLSVYNVSVHTVRLTWQPPVVHEKCVSNYLIIQCVAKLCNNTTVLATDYTASNLEPCTRYYFTVKTVTQTVQSAGVNETVRTASPSKYKLLWKLNRE